MKSTLELREFLIKQMQCVADGEQGSHEAKAICNYSQQVYNTMNLEMRYAILQKKLGEQSVKPVEFE